MKIECTFIDSGFLCQLYYSDFLKMLTGKQFQKSLLYTFSRLDHTKICFFHSLSSPHFSTVMTQSGHMVAQKAQPMHFSGSVSSTGEYPF